LSLLILRCGLTAPKITKINWYFWYKFAQKGYSPLSDLFYKILLGEAGRESQVCTMPNFTVVALKIWAYGFQNRENGNFLV